MPATRHLVAAIAAFALIACAWLAPLDAPAKRQIDANLQRALVSFAAARALNAVISVAQGTEAVIQPLGVGATLAVGQVLDPVNDLVEQLANLMLAVSVVIAAQKLLLVIGAYWLVSLALTAAVLGALWYHWKRPAVPGWLAKLLLVGLLLRFALPVVTLGTELLWARFLEPEYAASQDFIASTGGRIDKLGPAIAAPEDSGLLDRARDWIARNADLKKRFEEIRLAAEQATQHVVRLITVFLLQTVLLPLLLLWAFYAALRGLLSPRR